MAKERASWVEELAWRLNHPFEKTYSGIVKIDHFSKERGENSKNIWNHHLVEVAKLDDSIPKNC